MNLCVDLAPGRPGELILRNPIMAGPGPYGYGRETMRALDLSRLGALVTRRTTLRRQPGDPPPRLTATPAGVLLGEAPSPGLQTVLSDHAAAWAGWPFPVILAVAGQSPDDYATIGSQVAGAVGVAALEMDLAGVPSGTSDLLAQDPDRTREAVSQLRETCGLPVIARLPWRQAASLALLNAAIEGGASAVTLAIGLAGTALDVGSRRLGTSGSLSGPALAPLMLQDLRECREAELGVPLIASEGIHSAGDAVALLLAGATAVQITTVIYTDPRAPAMILDDLEQYCEDNKIKDINELVGAAR